MLQASLRRSVSSVTAMIGRNNDIARRSMAAAAASDDAPPLMKTALNEWHKALGGEMVPFAGYELPVLYKGDNVKNGGVMKEHLWCRSEGKASLFDVSHMGQVRVYCVLLLYTMNACITMCIDFYLLISSRADCYRIIDNEEENKVK